MERTPTRPAKPYSRKLKSKRTDVTTESMETQHAEFSTLKEEEHSTSSTESFNHFAIPIQAMLPHDMPTPPLSPVPMAVAPCTKELGRFPLSNQRFFGNQRFAVVCVFNGETKVHIREYTDEKYPTLKGICLTPSRWTTLVRAVSILDTVLKNSVDECISMQEEEECIHLGGFMYAKQNCNYDIRQYFLPNGAIKEIPKNRGITIRRFEWAMLKERIDEITHLSPELIARARAVARAVARARPCSESLDHSNLQRFLACAECNLSGDTVL